VLGISCTFQPDSGLPLPLVARRPSRRSLTWRCAEHCFRKHVDDQKSRL